MAKSSSRPDPRTLDLQGIRAAAVEEAFDRLGLLEPTAKPVILDMLVRDTGEHPRAVCTAYRKAGEQLTRDELRASGMRANAFMSREAFAQLTAKGKENPIQAHSTTMLRAFFTTSRWRWVAFGHDAIERLSVDPKAVHYFYDMLPPMCPRCKSLDGTEVRPETALIYPAEDCQCVTANYSILTRVDFLYGIK